MERWYKYTSFCCFIHAENVVKKGKQISRVSLHFNKNFIPKLKFLWRENKKGSIQFGISRLVRLMRKDQNMLTIYVCRQGGKYKYLADLESQKRKFQNA